MMEPCCWGNYTQHRDAHKNLLMFDALHDEENDELDEEEVENIKKKTRQMGFVEKMFLKFRPIIWSVLEKPYSSRYAQVSTVFIEVCSGMHRIYRGTLR